MRAWILACLLIAGSVQAAVSPPFIANGESEPIVRVDLRQDSAATSPAEPLTGLDNTSSGLAISCIASPQSTWTDYTAAGSTIETIATIGTYAAPTASNVRFAEIESEGVYELQFETSLFSVTDSTHVTCKISGATDLATRTFTMSQQLSSDTQIAEAVRDVDNTSPAADSLGEDAAQTDTLVAGIIEGATEAGTLSTTQATTDLTGFDDDQLIGRVIIFTSGPAEGEATNITDYASTGGTLTFTELTTAPTAGNSFKII